MKSSLKVEKKPKNFVDLFVFHENEPYSFQSCDIFMLVSANEQRERLQKKNTRELQ